MKKLNQYTKYIRPILVLEKYLKNDQANNEISSILADKFFSASNFVYEHFIDDIGVGVIAGNIGSVETKPLDYEGLRLVSKNFPEYKDQVEFQIRIMDKIAEMDDDSAPELNCLCSLDRTHGIGKLMISKWENELLKRGIHKYHLFTDDNCNFHWYEKNGFKLLNQQAVKIDDLPDILKHHSKFNVYHFEKQI